MVMIEEAIVLMMVMDKSKLENSTGCFLRNAQRQLEADPEVVGLRNFAQIIFLAWITISINAINLTSILIYNQIINTKQSF